MSPSAPDDVPCQLGIFTTLGTMCKPSNSIDSREPEVKEASSNKKKSMPLDSMLEKLARAGGSE